MRHGTSVRQQEEGQVSPIVLAEAHGDVGRAQDQEDRKTKERWRQ